MSYTEDSVCVFGISVYVTVNFTCKQSFDRFCLGCLGHLRDYNLNVMAAKEWVYSIFKV